MRDPIESLLHEKKREYLQREAEQETWEDTPTIQGRVNDSLPLRPDPRNKAQTWDSAERTWTETCSSVEYPTGGKFTEDRQRI